MLVCARSIIYIRVGVISTNLINYTNTETGGGPRFSHGLVTLG